MFALLLPGFLAALLIGPRAPGDMQSVFCVHNMFTSTPFGLSLNCDAPGLLSTAYRPSDVLDKGNLRQSRPLMVMPGAILRPLFTFADDAPKWLGIRPADDMPDNYKGWINSVMDFGMSGFIAFAVFNLALLCVSFWLYLRLVGGALDAASAVLLGAIGLLLVGNDVVKAFFWSPHGQLYNILIPLVTVWAMSKPAGAWRRGARVGLLSGIGALAFPLFLIVPACFAIRAVFDAVVEKEPRRIISGGAALAATFVAPIAWYLFVLWYVGSFYSDSLAFNQGIWIIDSLRRGTFGADLAVPAGSLWFNLLPQLYALSWMFVLALVLFVLAVPRLNVSRSDVGLCVAAFVVSFVAFAFYALAGLNTARSVASVIPPLIVVCGVLARVSLEASRPWAAWPVAFAVLAVAYAQLIFTAVKVGPYS
jgi:hypothetical protein